VLQHCIFNKLEYAKFSFSLILRNIAFVIPFFFSFSLSTTLMSDVKRAMTDISSSLSVH
jgi:hypothetical protein